jgi:hypothetical protein
MKKIVIPFFLTFVSFTAFSQTPVQCKTSNGNVLAGSITEIKQIINSNSYRPQMLATGVVSTILPDDTQGLPHQKYSITVGGQLTLEVVSNLDFGRVPLQIGQTISVCGEYINAENGMIHWTHFDPHGGHANGFTIANGQVFGEQQTSTTGESTY